jgi:hypothetical protein
VFTAWYGLDLWIKPQWLLYVPPCLTFNNSTFCPHIVFMCFVWISEQTAIISLYNINWLVCVTETECVYCAVRTETTLFLDICSRSLFSLREVFQLATAQQLTALYRALMQHASTPATLFTSPPYRTESSHTATSGPQQTERHQYMLIVSHATACRQGTVTVRHISFLFRDRISISIWDSNTL